MADDIELAVFDMDGVLVRIDRPLRLTLLSRFTGKTPKFLQETLFASDFERGAEMGVYATGAEYLEELNRRIQTALTREQWITARREAMTPIETTFVAARELVQHRTIATLTNNGPLLKESIGEILPDAAALFGVHFHATFEFGARKPDPLVFERLARHYSVRTSRVLFIDDDPEHVRAAQTVGIHAFEFPGPEALFERLRGLGVLP